MRRRDFVKTVAASGVAAAVAPAIRAAGDAKAVVIASANGNKFKNGGPRTCVEEAFLRIARGADVLDAVIAGVNIVELDPDDDSVGYGGLPNAEGIVQLDSSCMHGPTKRAGGVAALEGVRTPSLVAKAVLDETDHHLLVGKGAQDFARGMGFRIEDDLNTEHSRKLWLEWKRRIDPEHWLDPAKRAAAGARARSAMIAEGLLDRDHVYGTIHCSAVAASGDIGAVTTTSGLSWKIPGRVGDSPILGAGIYVDGDVGAAGSTGRGEANLFNLSSFFIVECLRRGMHPKDAGLEALRRVKASTIEKRLRNSKGNPGFDLKFYVLSRAGEHAGVSLYADSTSAYSVCTEAGARLLPLEPLLPGKATD
jgi:N4-(beta-N-acetylglucosaminyl)-L-asparaginase